ncbi:hypothetical protein MTR_1g113060 [Medicago truncatula]|uniref:Uncharacterized protein n=1 Tax=Medicago truncatula TaxID=3880 RepID=A0A072VRX1_MEDTR|nr:hypothetical protein MTR_1g113060 [Medicago truncatula]
MFTGLTILRITSFKPASCGIKDENNTVSLERPGDHVLNEIPMSGGINESAIVLDCSNLDREMSIVIPLSRSALNLSSTQAYVNERMFISVASFSSLSMSFLSIPPSL